MDIVSFETAKKLKAAGFPQPDAIRGQIWYADNGNSFIVYAVNDGHHDLISESGNTWIGRYKQDPEMFFAPAATDIMRYLKDQTISFTDSGWIIEWIDQWGDSWYEIREQPQHDNPAECAAIAYLAKHKTPV